MFLAQAEKDPNLEECRRISDKQTKRESSSCRKKEECFSDQQAMRKENTPQELDVTGSSLRVPQFKLLKNL